MDIRGVGDGKAMRRLLWLFLTTVLAPSFVLGLMALGALGHRQWTADEIALQKVEVQLPFVAEEIDGRTTALDAAVRALALACPAATCPPPTGAASWSPDGSWQVDREAMLAWARTRFVRAADDPVELALSDEIGGAALHGALEGSYLVARLPEDLRATANPWLRIATAMSMLALVVIGLVFGLGAAAREIAMSQRQIELLGRVSHELRTPLTSIHMFVEALREGHLDAEREKECLDLLSGETDRLSRRIQEVLHWARMEAGARRYRPEPAAVDAVVREAIDAFRAQALFEDAQDLELSVQVPDGLPDLLVDRDAIVEAVINLLVNAWRHTEAPRRVVISAVARPYRVGLSVTDNGPGIARSDRRRIFEKFYQSEEDDQRHGTTRGLGLGLAIVRAIVRGHQGRIELTSRPGEGSTFTLWLPIV